MTIHSDPSTLPSTLQVIAVLAFIIVLFSMVFL